PGAPTMSERSGKTLPSVTTAPAAINSPADDRLVINDRLHADRAAVANRAAVQHRLVAHGDVRANRHRVTRVDVQHRAVLHVGVVAYCDCIVVATDHRARPHAGLFAQANLADY